MRKLFLLCILFAAGVVVCQPVSASPFVINVSGQSNIFGAGHSTVPGTPSSEDSGPGALPSQVNFTPQPYLYLYFPGMTGEVSFNRDPNTFHGADGIAWGDLSTNIASTGGISGVQVDGKVLFLVGVFLNDNEPVGAGPAIQDTRNAETTRDFAPEIGQAFYVGNGLTTGGQTQRFWVPTGATRLYLGFADGMNFTGTPSWYNDNFGGFTATGDWGTGTPEPGTVILVSLGLGAAFWRVRRIRKAS